VIITLALLLAAAVAIYVACSWFVNGVEWLGVRLNVGAVAVGTVLAAIGTALPESVVTFVAVAFGNTDERKQIGVGAAMGGPLVLSTVAYATVGIVLLLTTRSFSATIPGRRELLADQSWFFVVFLAKLGLGLVAFAWKPWLGLAFLAAYGWFAYRELQDAKTEGSADTETLDPLKLQPGRSSPTTWAVFAQCVGTLVVIFVASEVFVGQLDQLGPALGLSPALVALLFAPVATELPEVLNAVIWVRQGKPELAVGNISGSMMIQATIPSALGIGFTPWLFDWVLTMAGVVTLLSIVLMIVLGRQHKLSSGTLLIGGVLYAGFVTAVLMGLGL
jgi:cation:H+ antiporter